MILRVFPRRTSYTPRDPYTFVGDPPLWLPPAAEVHVSVTFTWDAAEGQRLRESWAQHYPFVLIGGPAFGSQLATDFTPGMYVRPGVTFTSRGCDKCCPWCLVPNREGPLRTLAIRPGWIVQDNNLLATPRWHQERVFEMLRAQRRRVDFPGGLEARRVDDWVAEQLRTLRIGQAFLAADTPGALPSVREAVRRLDFLTRRQLRCYVLIAFGGETIAQAEDRLRAVWDAGCLPFAQLFQPPDDYIHYGPGWRALARQWSRPAAMYACHDGSEVQPGGPDFTYTGSMLPT